MNTIKSISFAATTARMFSMENSASYQRETTWKLDHMHVDLIPVLSSCGGNTQVGEVYMKARTPPK